MTGSLMQGNGRDGKLVKMEITRIERVNLVDEVYHQLRGMITSGTWSEGIKLDGENLLAERFSVSRVVIREALQKLRAERLIITRQGVGTFVANPSNFVSGERIDLTEEVYRQFIAFREAVEYTSIQLAEAAAGEEDFARVDAAADEMEACERQGDQVKYNIADFNFHLEIVRCGHNEFLEKAMIANQAAFIGVFNAMNAVPGSSHFGVTSHRELSARLRQRNTKAIIRVYNEMARYNLARLASFFSTNQPKTPGWNKNRRTD